MSGNRPSEYRRLLSRLPLPRPWLVLFLAGPVIWYGYFWAVYLLAEAVCSPANVDASRTSLLVLAVVVLTIVAVGLISWLALRARRFDAESGHRGELARTGTMLGFVFVLATLFVGLPAVLLSPC